MSMEGPERHEFQAEVKQLLDIVVHALYTDKEIFVRELVSNAADALAKVRFQQLKGEAMQDDHLPLEINITTDDGAGTLTIQDYGIGLTRQELVENLGTIARSGSKAFAQALKEANQAETLSLIGQFGVGFYSAFMVAEEVRVYTHSWRPEGESLVWISDGGGSYRIEETPDLQRRGAKIVVKLKAEAREFAQASRVEEILRRYSSFVAYPINLNGKRANTQEALWAKNKAEVTAEQYRAFYQFQANAFDDPRYTLHFSADAPLALHALLFTPTENPERWGFGRIEPGVALYCKKVLIDPKPEGLLPDWLRYVRGVVDSADLPLNISRETMQDSALVRKLNQVITGRYLKSLADEADRNPEAYADFYLKFGHFLKEGLTTDAAQRERLAKLLRFESSLTEGGKLTSLADYVGRMGAQQKAIYYLAAPRRSAIESGPYLEAFKARGLEVLFLYEALDEFVVTHLNEFEGKKLLAADQAELELDEAAPSGEGQPLSEEATMALAGWLKEVLGERVSEVRSSRRLVNSPVAALNADKFMSPGMRRVLASMNRGEEPEHPRVTLEINPRHGVIHHLEGLRGRDGELAKLVAEQLFDTALIAAGYLEDPRRIVDRVYRLLERVGSAT